MKNSVRLKEVVEVYDMISFENQVFIDRENGEIVNIFSEYLRKAENEEPYDRMRDWEQEAMKQAYDIIESEGRFIELSKYDIDEYRIMEKFCYTVADPFKEEALFNAINGRGAFRRFKDLIYKLEVAEDWYDYKYEAYKQVAREFCEMHHISYIE